MSYFSQVGKASTRQLTFGVMGELAEAYFPGRRPLPVHAGVHAGAVDDARQARITNSQLDGVQGP